MDEERLQQGVLSCFRWLDSTFGKPYPKLTTTSLMRELMYEPVLKIPGPIDPRLPDMRVQIGFASGGIDTNLVMPVGMQAGRVYKTVPKDVEMLSAMTHLAAFDGEPDHVWEDTLRMADMIRASQADVYGRIGREEMEAVRGLVTEGRRFSRRETPNLILTLYVYTYLAMVAEEHRYTNPRTFKVTEIGMACKKLAIYQVLFTGMDIGAAAAYTNRMAPPDIEWELASHGIPFERLKAEDRMQSHRDTREAILLRKAMRNEPLPSKLPEHVPRLRDVSTFHVCKEAPAPAKWLRTCYRDELRRLLPPEEAERWLA